MKRIEANCPSCGAVVEFKTGMALVTICPNCRSVVARGDRKVEDLGKVAALVPTESALHLGATGRFRDRPFEVIGHVQYQHPAGGVWDEWYVSLPAERWYWLAEAQGKLYLTQEYVPPKSFTWPPLESLAPGQTVELDKFGVWTVSEVNSSTCGGAEGELPTVLKPGATHRFADLTRSDNRFGTIDYDETSPRWFSGQEVTLTDLGLSAPAHDNGAPVTVAAQALSCPNCGGPLELKAPDAAQRVTCPNCASLLDVDQGQLKYLMSLKSTIAPLIPIGREGKMDNVTYTIIGFMRREVTFDRQYTWDEYLLYEPAVGFRWLVYSDLHWSFVEPVATADVTHRQDLRLTWHGQRFRLFQRAWARVTYVLGEFYWKVSIDNIVLSEDYTAPPRLITIEQTPSPDKPLPENLNAGNGWQNVTFSEMNVSLATYRTHQQVEQAFGVANLPRGFLVAPNQPAPGSTEIYRYWAIFVVAIVLIDLLLSAILKHPIDHGLSFWAAALVAVVPIGLMLVRSQFERSRWRDSEFSPYGDS